MEKKLMEPNPGSGSSGSVSIAGSAGSGSKTVRFPVLGSVQIRSFRFTTGAVPVHRRFRFIPVHTSFFYIFLCPPFFGGF